MSAPATTLEEAGMTPVAVARFWMKVTKTDGCWFWTGAPGRDGYGRLSTGTRTGNPQRPWPYRNHPAHRLSVLLDGRTIPHGLVVDHLCRVRICVRPDHLEVVDQRTNLLRGDGASAVNAKRTHCPQGHPYAGDNVQISPQGFRRCRRCGYLHNVRRRAAARQAVSA